MGRLVVSFARIIGGCMWLLFRLGLIARVLRLFAVNATNMHVLAHQDKVNLKAKCRAEVMGSYWVVVLPYCPAGLWFTAGLKKLLISLFALSAKSFSFLKKDVSCPAVLRSPARTPVCFYRFTTLTKTGTQIILRRHKLHGMVLSFVKANTRPRTKVNSLSGYFCLQ